MDIVKIAVLASREYFLQFRSREKRESTVRLLQWLWESAFFIYLLTKEETVLLFVDSIKSQPSGRWQIHRAGGKRWWESRMWRNLRRTCAGIPVILRSQGQIEMFAKLSILVVSVPVFGAFLDAVGSFL